MARRKEVQIKRDIEEMQSKKEAQEEYVMSGRKREVDRDREEWGSACRNNKVLWQMPEKRARERESFGSERREIEEEKEREGERVQDFENEIRYILREREE